MISIIVLVLLVVLVSILKLHTTVLLLVVASEVPTTLTRPLCFLTIVHTDAHLTYLPTTVQIFKPVYHLLNSMSI